MATIFKNTKTGKYTFVNSDSQKAKKGEVLIASGVDKKDAYDAVSKANKGDTTLVTSHKIKYEQQQKIEADKKSAEQAAKDTEKKKKEAEKAKERGTIEVGGVRYDDTTGDITDITPGSEHEGQRIAKKDTSTPDGEVQVAEEVGEEKYLNQPLPTTNTSLTPAKKEERGAIADAMPPETIKETEKIDQTQFNDTPETTDTQETPETTPSADESTTNNVDTETDNGADGEGSGLDNIDADGDGDLTKGDKDDAEDAAKKDPEKTTEEITENKNLFQKLFDAWKSGELDMYPFLKSIVDSIAQGARMNLDRAALLTGGERDYDAYKPITTEYDNIREKQQDERAKLGMTVNDALLKAQKGEDYKPLARAVALGLIEYDKAIAGLEGTSKDAFVHAYENMVQKNDLEVEEQRLKVKNTYLEGKATLREAIRGLEAEKREIDKVINSLAGDDYNAYKDAADALQSVERGIKTFSNNYQATKTGQKSINGNASLNVKGVFNASGGGSSSDTDTSTGGSSMSQDEYLAQSLPETKQYAKGQMQIKNEANAKLIDSLEAQKAAIDDLIADIKEDYKEYTGKELTVSKMDYSPSTPTSTPTSTPNTTDTTTEAKTE